MSVMTRLVNRLGFVKRREYLHAVREAERGAEGWRESYVNVSHERNRLQIECRRLQDDLDTTRRALTVAESQLNEYRSMADSGGWKQPVVRGNPSIPSHEAAAIRWFLIKEVDKAGSVTSYASTTGVSADTIRKIITGVRVAGKDTAARLDSFMRAEKGRQDAQRQALGVMERQRAQQAQESLQRAYQNSPNGVGRTGLYTSAEASRHGRTTNFYEGPGAVLVGVGAGVLLGSSMSFSPDPEPPTASWGDSSPSDSFSSPDAGDNSGACE